MRTASLSALDNVLKAVAGFSVNEEYFQVRKANLQYGNTVSCGDGPYLSKPFCQNDFINRQLPYCGPRQSAKLHRGTSEAEAPRNNQSFLVLKKKKATKGGSKKSPSQFEAHAGWSAKRQPYRHIYTSSGVTLHDIFLMLANGQSLVTSDSDDMCVVCGDDGKLIICNGCQRAFHTGDFVPLIHLLSSIVIITSLWPNEFHHNICPDGEGCSEEQFAFSCYY